jgi:uncharacterized small protein (DUF1192 family)
MMKIGAKERADQRNAAVKIEAAQIDARVEERVAVLKAGLEKWKVEQEQKTELRIAAIEAAATVQAAKEAPRPTAK